MFSRFSVRSSTFLLEAVPISKLKGQKAYNDGDTDKMLDMYSCNLYDQTIHILKNVPH